MMNTKDLILWISLVVLTLLAYFFSESAGGKILLYTLLIVTSIKFLGVGFQFMELKKAHGFWKISFVFLLVVFIGLVLILN